jgi:hypothetical protein
MVYPRLNGREGWAISPRPLGYFTVKGGLKVRATWALGPKYAGKGLLLWYSDGAYDAGIFEICLSGETLEYHDLWKGPNDGNWPTDIPKTDINWIDVQKGADVVFVPPANVDSQSGNE